MANTPRAESLTLSPGGGNGRGVQKTETSSPRLCVALLGTKGGERSWGARWYFSQAAEGRVPQDCNSWLSGGAQPDTMGDAVKLGPKGLLQAANCRGGPCPIL